MKLKRLQRIVNIERYLYQGIQIGAKENIYEKAQYMYEIKEAHKRRMVNPSNEKAYHIFINNRQYETLPDRCRLNQFDRYKALCNEAKTNEEKCYYLLKIGMLYYKHYHSDYHMLSNQMYEELDPFSYTHEEEQLGSHRDWYSYLNCINEYGDNTYREGQREKTYDLRQNMYLATYSIECLKNWEYDELRKYYGRHNIKELKAVETNSRIARFD